MLAAFQRRPWWQVACIVGEGEEVSQAASSSRFHWGEYERIDWGMVHEGTADSLAADLLARHACMTEPPAEQCKKILVVVSNCSVRCADGTSLC